MRNRVLAIALSLILATSAIPVSAVVDCGDAEDYTFSGTYYMSYPLSRYAQFPSGETPWTFEYQLHSDGSLNTMTKYLNNWSYDAPEDTASGNYNYGTIGVFGTSMTGGSKADAVLSFVCPYDGEILIPEAQVSCAPNSNDGVRVKLTFNDYALFPSEGWLIMSKGESHTFPETKLKVKKGDVLRWTANMAGPGKTNSTANTWSDGVYWYNFEVHYVNNSQSAAGYGNGVVSPFPVDIEYTESVTSPAQYFSKGVNGTGNWYFQNCEIDTDNYLNLDFINNQWFGGWYQNWTPGAIQSGTGVHAGEGGDPTFTYVCPKDGLIALPATTATCAVNSDDGIRVRILKNRAPIYPASGWIQVDPGATVDIPELLFEVQAGDQLHFRINCVADMDSDGGTWPISLYYAESDSYVRATFPDIEGHWAEDTIREMYEEGMVSGRANGTFEPEAPVTRAEFLTMALRACQFTESSFNDYFADVPFTAWYARSVITAHENNLIDYSMIEDKNLCPDQAITREEAASVMVNAHIMKKRRALTEADLTSYSDVATVSEWAESYLAKAVQLGLMQGNENLLNPLGTLTRAEAATLLANLLDELAAVDPDGTLSKVYTDAEGNYLPVYQNTDLEALIYEAYNNGESSITIPKGVYRMDAKANGLAIWLKDLSDFNIYADDVVLSYKSATHDVMRIQNCTNLELHGLAIDHEYNSTYQGIIQEVDTNGMYYDVWFDPGHVPNMLNTRFIGPTTSTSMYSEESGAILPYSSGRTIDGNLRKIGNDLYRFYVSKTAFTKNVRAGHIITGRSASGNNLTITGCSDLYFEDFTLYNGMSGIFESNAEKGSDYENLRIVPGPKPELATMERLRSVNGTGYFARGTRLGGTINNSEISATNDDGINVHAAYDRVAAIEGDNTYVIAASGSTAAFRVGDELRFTTYQGAILGEANIVSTEKLTGYTPSEKLSNFTASGGYYRVTLDNEIAGVSFGDRSCNMNTLLSGFTVTNSRFADNSPRAILTHAIDSTIENCEFVNVRRWAILAAPELPTWNEGDYMRNLTIKGCTFTGNGRGNDTEMAAIGIWGEPTMTSNYKGNQNINILNNNFSDNYLYDIVLSYVTDATVSGNTFGSQNADAAGYNMPEAACIDLFYADQVTFSDNTFTDSTRTKVLVGDDVTNVTGLPE